MKRAAMAQSLVQQAEEKQLASGIDERKQQAEQSVLRYAQENGREISELTDNPIFLRYLWDMGLEAEEADLLANKDKLKEDALERAKESIAASILAKKERIAENGAQGAQGAKKRKISPKSLTNADIDDILARVKNGEHITF